LVIDQVIDQVTGNEGLKQGPSNCPIRCRTRA